MHRDSSVLPARQPHRAHGAAAYTAIAERALHDQLVAVGLADRDTLRKRLDELGLADRLTISVPEAGRLLGLGETASYAAAHRGGRISLPPRSARQARRSWPRARSGRRPERSPGWP